MGFFDIFKKKNKAANKRKQVLSLKDLQALNNQQKAMINQYESLFAQMASRGIDEEIDEIIGNDYRTMTVSDLLYAIRQADQPWNRGYRSSWIELFDIFANMVQDTHVAATRDTIKESLLSKDFYIADEEGNRLVKETRIFKKSWFYRYLEFISNVKDYGFGLYSIDSIDLENMSVKGHEVNRKHVRPDLGGLVKAQYDTSVWRYWDKGSYKKSSIYVFDNILGKLTACARWYIYKTEVVRFWAKYNQLYGTPPVIGKTSVKDSTRRANMIKSLKNFVKARFMVIDQTGEVEQFNSSSSQGNQQFFENLIRLCDEQISKRMLGSTMVLDNGSSKSQAEVHDDNTTNFKRSLWRLAESTINESLIPKLLALGLPISKKSYFVWDESEKMSQMNKAEIINKMNANYKVPVDVAAEFVGIPLEEKETPPMFDMSDPKNKKMAIENYKGKFKDK